MQQQAWAAAGGGGWAAGGRRVGDKCLTQPLHSPVHRTPMLPPIETTARVHRAPNRAARGSHAADALPVLLPAGALGDEDESNVPASTTMAVMAAVGCGSGVLANKLPGAAQPLWAAMLSLATAWREMGTMRNTEGSLGGPAARNAAARDDHMLSKLRSRQIEPRVSNCRYGVLQCP